MIQTHNVILSADAKTNFIHFNAKQYDKNSHAFVCKILGCTEQLVNGDVVKASAYISGKTVDIMDCSVNTTTQKISFTLSPLCLINAGKLLIDVSVFSGQTVKFTLGAFAVDVIRSASEDITNIDHATLSERLATLQTTTNTLNNNVTQNTSDIATLQTTTNTLNSNITQNTSDIATLQTTTANLTADLHNVQNDINNISTNIGFVGKSTNLFDSENPNIVRLTGNVSTQKFATVSGTSIWIRVKPNSTITLNKVGGDRLQAFTAESIPAKNGDYVRKKQLGNNTTTLTISVEDDIYVLFYLSTDPDYDVSETVIFYGEEWIDENTSDVQTMKPVVDKLLNLSDIPFSNLINLLSYRPLGKLSKGYICLTCDDGSENLVKTTIPILKRYKAEYNKKIPVTFGLMSSSHIFKPVNYPIVIDGVTVDGVAAVKEMLSTDYGCEVAIHGDTSYLSYTTTELITFLNEQKEYLTDTLDKEPKSIIYPFHHYDTRTATICGSFYGVCATGGTYDPIKYSDCAGERSNLYTLYRLSLLNDNYMTKNRLKQKIDNCIENHRILLLFWHDNTLHNNHTLPLDPDNTTYQELLDYCVSYAIQNNVEFCTLGNIPYLK